MNNDCTGITLLFPLWERPTTELAHEMIASSLRAQITCIDPRLMPAALAGREYDAAFLNALPSNVEPGGENGEFYSFAFAGPMFTRPIDFSVGETVERDGFVFTDLLPKK
jgi:diphthamide synthase (EF-2-diphthine--ammonia ligase)